MMKSSTVGALLLLLLSSTTVVSGAFHNFMKAQRLAKYVQEHQRDLQASNNGESTTTLTCDEGYDDDASLALNQLAVQYGLNECAETYETLMNFMGNADLLCMSIGVGLCNCTCAGIVVEPSPVVTASPYSSSTEADSVSSTAAFSCDDILDCNDGEKAAQLLASYDMAVDDVDLSTWYCHELNDVGVVLWKVDSNTETITFAAELMSSGGGAGIGISSNGGMLGADLLVVTKDEGEEWILQDMFSTGYSYDGSLVTIDEVQDGKLEWATEDEERIAFVVTRPIKSCDSSGHDIEIMNGAVPFIWARFPSHGETVLYHGPGKENRGTIYLDLISEDSSGVASGILPEPEDSLFTIDLKMSTSEEQMYTLPNGQVNTYACKSFELPSDQPYHVVSYGALLDTAANVEANVVHHIVMYSCDEDPYTADPTECGSMAAVCQMVELTWAVGMPDQYLPEVAGLPLKKYVLLEMHYENLALQEDVQDGSGLRITFTNQLRQYDFGYILTGSDIGDTMDLEPGQPDVVRVGFCPTECLSRNLPETGVQVHGQFFHSHLLGRSLFTQLYHEGGGESESSPPDMMGDMPYYDFNHQSFKFFENEPRLYPGDTLVTTCHFDTTSESDPTKFGLETRDEMCLNVIGMYPAIDLKYCWNSTETGAWCSGPSSTAQDDSSWKYVDDPLPIHASSFIPGGASSYLDQTSQMEGCVEIQDSQGPSSTGDDTSASSSVATDLESESSGLSAGAIVGIVVGVLIVGVVGVYLVSSRREQATTDNANNAQSSPKKDEESGRSSDELTHKTNEPSGGLSSFMK